MNRYVKSPDVITFQDCVNKNYNLSASLFTKLIMKNTNCLKVSDFLTKKLSIKDLGSEIGSTSYIDKSTYFFMRTKALQKNSFIPEITSESVLPMKPKDFIKMNLKKGDLIISKDSNIGEAAILEKDYPDFMLSGAIYKLPVKEELRYYLFAMIKHDIFREQLDSIVPKGATIRHAKTLFLDCLIPLPNENKGDVIKYISELTQAIIEKETLIKSRHEQILKKIEEELKNNQKENEFKYSLPTFSEVMETGRLDTGIYGEYFKETNFLVTNYKYGSKDLLSKGFTYARGSSLEINALKTRIDSDVLRKGFYELVIPTNISQYGFVEKSFYIGTPAKLKEVQKGDIIFGGEGFGKGRTYVVIENTTNVVTNYHGIRIINQNQNLAESIFVRCFLAYWREKGMIDCIGVGGSGGHCAPMYFPLIEIPNFPENKQKEIVKLYYNPNVTYNSSNFTLENFLSNDSIFNQAAGIYELDKSAKYLKKLLNEAIDNIVNDRKVEFKF